MPVNVPQSTGQPPTTKMSPAPRVSAEAEKFCQGDGEESVRLFTKIQSLPGMWKTRTQWMLAAITVKDSLSCGRSTNVPFA